MPVQNISSIELKNCIVDELHLRERTDVNLTSSKDTWQIDTYLLAQFFNNLEAGSIVNNGIEIVQFAIKRRKLSEINNITLGYVDFVNGEVSEYFDYTQGNDDYIYTLVPIAENGLEGTVNEVQIKSDFTGWWIIDKTDSNNILACDTFLDGEPSVFTQLNQGRVVLETLNRFPQVYYTDKSYHTFTLSAAVPINPEENNSTSKEYSKILSMLNSRKPFIAKSGSGDLYIVEISNLRKGTPINTYFGRDYMTVNFDCLEILSETDYHDLY